MAVSGPVVISPDDLANGNGTLRRAMELWSCRHGPVRYDQWQSAFFAMMRMPGVEDEEAAPGESLSERQKRMAEMHDELQLGNFGPDHRASMLVAAAEDVADERPNVGAYRMQMYMDWSGRKVIRFYFEEEEEVEKISKFVITKKTIQKTL